MKVKKSEFIGEGYYGSGSELAMMKELRSRGPIVGDLNVPMGFSYYKEGIFSDDRDKALKGLLSNPEFVNNQTDNSSIVSNYTLNDYNIEW